MDMADTTSLQKSWAAVVGMSCQHKWGLHAAVVACSPLSLDAASSMGRRSTDRATHKPRTVSTQFPHSFHTVSTQFPHSFHCVFPTILHSTKKESK